MTNETAQDWPVLDGPSLAACVGEVSGSLFDAEHCALHTFSVSRKGGVLKPGVRNSRSCLVAILGATSTGSDNVIKIAGRIHQHPWLDVPYGYHNDVLIIYNTDDRHGAMIINPQGVLLFNGSNLSLHLVKKTTTIPQAGHDWLERISTSDGTTIGALLYDIVVLFPNTPPDIVKDALSQNYLIL